MHPPLLAPWSLARTGTGGPSTAAALAAGLVLGVPAAGCTSSGGHAADERRMMAALAEARDAVCACPDLACAETAERRLADFLLLHVDGLKKVPAPARGTVDAVAREASRLDGELRTCKRRLEEAGRASGSTRSSSDHVSLSAWSSVRRRP